MRTDKIIGYVDVDSGTITIGDPCYIVGQDLGWNDVCEEFFPSDGEEKPFIRFADHIMVSTLWGDGNYPVYAEYKDGQIAGIRIDFDPGFEED